MENSYSLLLAYKGREFQLEAVFVPTGFGHRFNVQLDDRQLIVEFDEERDYRVIETAAPPNAKALDAAFLELLVAKISALYQ
ncbi:MAG: hypothetical protein H7257_08210 [Taibaiella sp.]|nr:hypothetical protein [Taibaiella sp.]